VQTTRCESATALTAIGRIVKFFLQLKKMQLEFRQQVAAGLSSGCSRRAMNPALPAKL
jgi:hypothetical protein